MAKYRYMIATCQPPRDQLLKLRTAVVDTLWGSERTLRAPESVLNVCFKAHRLCPFAILLVEPLQLFRRLAATHPSLVPEVVSLVADVSQSGFHTAGFVSSLASACQALSLTISPEGWCYQGSSPPLLALSVL